MINKIWVFYNKYSFVLSALLIISILIKGVPKVSFVNYFFPIIMSILFIKYCPSIYLSLFRDRFFVLFMPFIIWVLLSSFWSLAPIVTVQWAFYFLFLILSALVLNIFISDNKIGTVKILLPGISIVFLLSFISLLFRIPLDYWIGGNGLGLKGFFFVTRTSWVVLCFSLFPY